MRAVRRASIGFLIGLALMSAGCIFPSAWKPIPVPKPTPTPVVTTTTTTTTLPAKPEGCSAPQGSWLGPGPVTTAARPAVLKVLRELAGCTEGSDCPLPGDDQQSWQERVTAELRALGLCAGQHQDGRTDQIAVAMECGGPWEGYYVFACAAARPDERDADGNPIDICPLVGRGKVRWAIAAPSWTPAAGCSDPAPVPTPTPSPTPRPSPSPLPTPAPEAACPLKIEGEHRLNAKLAIRRGGGGKVWADVTFEYYYGVKPDGTNAGPCGDPKTGLPRRWCDIGVDGGPTGVACQEALVGIPVWTGPVVPCPQPGPTGCHVDGSGRPNPFLADISGAGELEVCAEKTPGVCARLVLQ